jgi:hypothetical protein
VRRAARAGEVEVERAERAERGDAEHPPICVIVVVVPLMSAACSVGTTVVRCASSALNCRPSPKPPAPSSVTSRASSRRPAKHTPLIEA